MSILTIGIIMMAVIVTLRAAQAYVFYIAAKNHDEKEDEQKKSILERLDQLEKELGPNWNEEGKGEEKVE